jgi:hypothetical protein
MTGQQMLDAFDVYFDKIANLAAPPYIDSEKLLFLNNAQDDFVKERVFGKNFQPPAFDDNEKRVADIRPLVKSSPFGTAASGIYGNSIRTDPYNSDNRFLYEIKVDVQLSRTNPTFTQKYIPCTKINQEDAGKFRSTEFNRLWFKYPVYFGTREDGIHIIGDYYTSFYDYCRIDFVSRPFTITALTTDFDGGLADGRMSLEPHTHQEIVNMAVWDALDVSGDKRIQTATAKTQIKTA